MRKTQGAHLRQAMERVVDSSTKIQELQTYYQQIFTRTFESFLEFNEKIIREEEALKSRTADHLPAE